MYKNLDSYVQIKHNFLDDSLCKKVLKDLKKVQWQPHTFTENNSGKLITLSGKKELECGYVEQNNQNTKLIMNKFWFEIDNYIKQLKFPWFNGWNGYSHVRYNKYQTTKQMAEHYDNISSLFKDGGMPILSLVVLLNDDFKGGELVMFKDVEYKLKAGDLIIFPSSFLYPHKVNPVKKGTRFSAVSWVW